ncbi:UNVERIFIED_CONTAM: hypothetical protein FKN15_049598 [Acipenser sinensis]
MGRLGKEHRWGSLILSRNHSLEEEFERAKAAVESDTEFWDKMQAEWEELARRNWLTENQEPQIPLNVSLHEKGYYFHTDNPYKDWPNAFEDAVKKVKDGDLPNAVLLLESAILQDPHDPEAWLVLGTTQAENENEQAAIVALQRAVDAFNAALAVRPEDYLLWNRLGATLANGDRSEEAVEAYTKALEIQPGFIRSRYNLGISCINLGAHREAASNFLTALSLQRKSSSRQLSHQVISGNIWAALRISLSMMDQPELFQAANIGDLDLLLKAFNLEK